MSKRIFIAGDSPLVEEYAALCAGRGYSVAVRTNASSTSRSLPRSVKRAGKPSRTHEIAFELTNLSSDTKRRNIIEIERTLSRFAMIISSSTTITLAQQSSWMKTPGRLVGIGALPSLLSGSLVELTKCDTTSDGAVASVQQLFSSLNKETVLVRDFPGLVMPRIWCTLINEAYFAMGEGVASGGDIDTGMKLGTNYPSGPVEMASTIGIPHVRAVLTALFDFYGEDRYRMAPPLRTATPGE